MNRISRKKYMRLAAAVLSAAVLISSMDVSMLRVYAAQAGDVAVESDAGMLQGDVEDVHDNDGSMDSQENEELSDESDVQKNEGSRDGADAQKNEGSSDESDVQENEGSSDESDVQENEDLTDDSDSQGNGAVSDNNVLPEEEEVPEDTGDSENPGSAEEENSEEGGDDGEDAGAPEDPDPNVDEIVDNDNRNGLDDAADSSVMADDGTSPEPVVPVQTTVSISGISIADKAYDGKPTAYTGMLKATAKIGEGSTAKVEDVTASITFSYTITGTVYDGSPDGSAYSESGTITGAGGTITGLPKNVGTYRLQVSASGKSSDKKYDFTGATEYSFDITKRTVTVRAKDTQIKITATALPNPLEYSYSGFVNGEDFITKPVFTCDTVEFGKPGRYAISGSGADAGPNYTIEYQQGTLTVMDKERVTITGVVISDKIYDAKKVTCNTENLKAVDADNVSVTGLTYSYSIVGEEDDGTKIEYKSAENLTIGKEISDGMPQNAGQYKLKIKVSSEVAGYKGIQQYNFDITKRHVTVKADDVSIKNGSKLPAFSYTVKGFLKDDGSALDGTSEDQEILEKFVTRPVLSCNVKDTGTPGEYTIRPSGAYAGPNYLMKYETGTLTVLEEDQVTITGIEVFNKIYDGQPAEFKINADAYVELEDGTKVENIDFTFTYSILNVLADGATDLFSTDIENNRPKDAGQYMLQVTAAGTPAQGTTGETYRYTKEYPFTITPRPVEVKVKDVELRTEDELPQTYEYEIGSMGFLEGDDFKEGPRFFCDIENTNEPGTYPITASGANAGPNYSITYQPGTLTVIQKEVEKTRTFLRVIAPQPVINIENGTPLEQMALPDSVTIKTRNIGTADGEVTGNETEEITETTQVIWERKPVDGTSYSAVSPTAQTFKLQGTVVLPADVAGPEVPEGAEDPLSVKIQVSVREQWISREKVAKPKASIATGTAVRRGTKVTLSCDTEGAEIYYTLDASKPPTRESNRYTHPIEINGYTVIWAFAYKEGYPDSEYIKFSYYTSTNIEGEDSDDSDVLEEDIPSGGIPSGLWSSTLKEYTYTGKAIKPEIRVYDHKTRLQEKKDYTIAYKNNVNAANKDSQKAPTITITGKGNYEGRLIKTFTILPKDIGDSDVIVDDMSVLYNKKAQKPAPTVKWNGKKLVKNKDYTIPEESYTEIGSRNITVTGIGNYTGKRMFEFVITDGVPMSKVTVKKIPDQVYTGKEIKPMPVVKYKGRLLELNKHYTVSYDDKIKEVGTASLFIKGVKGGEFVGTRRVTFKIKAVASLSKAKVSMEFSTATPVYTGKEITANRLSVMLTVKDSDGNPHEVRLVQNVDYKVVYNNNVEAGKATAVFAGMGAYSGTIRKTFQIAPRKVDSMQVKIKLNSSYTYCKGGSRPEPQVTFGNKTLKLGRDYTLSYKQNNKSGQTARVIVKGKGNFGGSVDKTFTVTPQEIGKLKVDAADKVYQNKSNIYKTTVRVLDTNDERLSAGKDYDKKVKYTYSAPVKVEIAGASKKTVLRKAGDPVDEKDIIPQGTVINVTVTAVGNDYTGSVSGTFRIIPASISSARVTIPVQVYTGEKIELDPAAIQVELKGTPLLSTDYEIVGYSNNINKGTAKVTIHGLNNYGGTKTVSFKIKSKKLAGQ